MENQIIMVLVTAVLSILGIVIPVLAKIVGEYVKAKLLLVKQKIGSDTYDSNVKMAISLVKIIEEKFRLGELASNKVEEFEKVMLDKVPTLTQAQIDDLRNLAVQEVNNQIGKKY